MNDQIKDILRRNAMHIIDIFASDDEVDKKEATDMVVTTTGGSIAIRIRRNTTFRDLTIRSYRSNGCQTELQKLREGFADWYLYAWSSGNTIIEYVLVNMNAMRRDGLLDDPLTEIRNKDGRTGFVYFSLSNLRAAGAIVAEWKLEDQDLWTLAGAEL